MKKALITGASGQDGSYLAQHLIELGYEVHGMVRRHSVAENQDLRIQHLEMKRHYADMTDILSLVRIITEINPDEIFLVIGCLIKK